MNNRPKYALLIAAIIGGIVLLFLLFRRSHGRVDWRETYAEHSKAPYGTRVIAELLATYFPGQEFHLMRDSFSLPANAPGANYICVGEASWLEKEEAEQLLEFVRKGGRAFLALKILPHALMGILYEETNCKTYDYEYFEPDYWIANTIEPDTAVRLRLTHPNLSRIDPFVFKYYYNHRPWRYQWQYYEPDTYCMLANEISPLGYLNENHVNFLRLAYGRGQLLIHTNPLVFTNIQLLEEDALRYADRVFTHLAVGPIYWDESSKFPEYEIRRRRASPFGPSERRISQRSPLQYVLAQPALTWAWYLLLALALLYLLFGAKRRQRVMPVLEKNTNTSLEFLSTIGRLYFLQNDHRSLACQKMKLFFAFIRDRYGLHAREIDAEFLENLAAKSEIPLIKVQGLFRQYEKIEGAPQIDAHTLIDFHRRMEYIYKHCK
jgi:hypothetical protein